MDIAIDTRTRGRRGLSVPIPNPFSSVRGAIITGFVVLVLILAVVIAAAAWVVHQYESDTSAMQQYAASGAALRDAEANSTTAALLTLRYVMAGGDNYPAEIRAAGNATTAGLQKARDLAAQRGDQEWVAKMDDLLKVNAGLLDDKKGTEAMIALRQSGQIRQAVGDMEASVPIYRDFRLGLTAAADDQLQRGYDLQSRAETTGKIAFGGLIASGVVGIVFGLAVAVFITRSIIRPLSSLESTAAAVSNGNYEARADVRKPRELAHLGQTLNLMMGRVLDHAAQIEERSRQLTDARYQAATDGLTGLYNHRAFQERVREQMAAAGPSAPFSLVMLDIDEFKRINDSLGHQEGDRILRDCAAKYAQIAGSESVFRYGGDEIAVVLPGLDIERAEQVAEQLREATMALSDGATRVTVSLGVAAFRTTASTPDELIYQADAAMYAAKSAGKNRVRRWEAVGSG